MFTDPFRYIPHPLVETAAGKVMKMLEEWSHMPEDSEERRLERYFAEGKMLGVLVVEPQAGKENCPDFIAAFSGNIGGKSIIKGFVPPVFDLTDPAGDFKKGEAMLNDLNRSIAVLESSERLDIARKGLNAALSDRESAVSQMKKNMAESKHRRDCLRKKSANPLLLEQLVKESQFEKAELRRLKQKSDSKVDAATEALEEILAEITALKEKRASMSENLQKRIFEQYVVSNADGESRTIGEIFSKEGLVPPGGTGECAAPKLLQYAYTHGMKPLHMGEFWYGKSPEGPVRTHGHFYPSCTSKCGPLLGFMLKGLDVQREAETESLIPVIVHEDTDIIVVSKPSGMPSVPGLDGKLSLTEWLQKTHMTSDKVIHAVHRLDMDTSGIMVFAKSTAAAVFLRRQFEEHNIVKTYCARLSPAGSSLEIFPPLPEKGCIRLALSPDYDERPRQKVDPMQGKEAVTEYEIQSVNSDGTVEILFHPITGRTHQLRVHSAHMLGLGRPIAGDLLYGGVTADRLCLHATSISFTHPGTGEKVKFSTTYNIY